MIFMSQSTMVRTEWLYQFGLWYQYHLSMMRSVPGIRSAQRFETAHPAHPASLALYTVPGPEIFKDPYYLEVRGLREWLPFIDKSFHRRNLFDGLEAAPEVSKNCRLLIADRDEPDASLTGFNWLTTVGLDFSTRFRGLAVVRADADRALNVSNDVAVYVPVSGYRDPELCPKT